MEEKRIVKKNYLKERRLELNLTIENVAEFVGVSPSTVSRWETGNIGSMRQNKIVKMAEILRASELWVMGFDLSNLDVELQKALEEKTAKYKEISSKLFGKDLKAKEKIIMLDSLIKSLNDLDCSQIDEVIKFIDYLKSKNKNLTKD